HLPVCAPSPTRIGESAFLALLSIAGACAMFAVATHRVRLSVSASRVERAHVIRDAGGWLAGWRRGILTRLRTEAPMLWAKLRTWRGHIVPWVSIWVVFPMEIGFGMDWANWGIAFTSSFPVWLLASIVALAAASCMHDERASGAAELVLTVPRGSRRLLLG